MAKSLKSLIRLHEWELDARRRELAEELDRLDALENGKRAQLSEIAAEQQTAGPSADPWVQMAYGPYAERARTRLDQLETAIEIKAGDVAQAQDAMTETFRDLKVATITQENRERREQAEIERKDQAVLDEVGQTAHRRRMEEGR